MRAVVQRVLRAEVRVEGELVGAIERGLLAYVGVERGDEERDVAYVARKLVGLRVFADERGRMSRSVRQVGGALLLVSQFTLHGDVRRGLRPSFDAAAEPEAARRSLQRLAACCRAEGVAVAEGRFRAHMHVEALVDGPVTILVDSRKAF